MDEKKLHEKYKKILPHLSEKQKRIFLSAESEYFGHGGISKVSRLSGISRVSITKGMKELNKETCLENISISSSRKKGGGRKRAIDKNPLIWEELKLLLEPYTRGEPESPLLWTSKSLRNLSIELRNKGINVSYRVIGEILKEKGFSLQANRKVKEGSDHVDRDAQFGYIYEKVKSFQQINQPVISVDAKKKELVGNFKNSGQEWRPKGEAEKVKVYDFFTESEGKAIPYGVYDVNNDEAWVSVGINNDTAEFAVQTIRNWWYKMGIFSYPGAKQLFITADGGGSNGSRIRLWKSELQKLSDETGLELSISHYPPGTSKWNKIEHRLFSYISKNWRGKPLITYQTIVNLIGSTTTKTGLKVNCTLDKNEYKKAIKVTDKEFEEINILRDKFHGEWNYTIKSKNNFKM